MKQKDEIKTLVQSIIHLHETKDFEGLLAYISEAEIKAGTWFSQKRFIEVCEAIETEIGSITSLEFLGALNRKTSYLTLWKATYSKSNDEVLWQIIFDTGSNKIRLMHINWEHI
jgi:hypothetical protein